MLTRGPQLAPLPLPSKHLPQIISTDLAGENASLLTAVRLGLRLFGHGFVSGIEIDLQLGRCSIGIGSAPDP
jgi:hypothetical protein